MADDFTGVPEREWHQTAKDAALGRLFGWLALSLAVLIVLTLIEKGVLGGWSDLIKPGHAHG